MGGDISINITIVGSPSTGKSTIVYLYTGRNYLNSYPHTKEMQPMTTIHSVKRNDKFYELCIRDTCGSSMEDMRSYNLCSNSDAVIICFDLLKKSTFQRAKRWIADLRANKKISPILLLIGTAKHETAMLSKQCTAIDTEAQQLVKDSNIFYQTVCLSEQDKISDIFTMIIDTFSASSADQNIVSTTDKKEDDDTEPQQFIHLMKMNLSERDPEALKIKIILLGDSNVGKTTFRCRLETNRFDIALSATLGVDFSCFKSRESLNGKYNVEIQLMDPSGLEIFKTITKQFYRGVHGVILFCDVTNMNSWNNIKYWMDEVLYNCTDDVITMLMCNKMDLMEQNKTVSQQIIDDAKTYADKYHMKMYNISCKEGEYAQYAWKGFEQLVNDIVCNKELYLRIKKEQGFEALDRIKTEFPGFIRSDSILSVDGRPYDINKGTIKRTCVGCDSNHNPLEQQL